MTPSPPTLPGDAPTVVGVPFWVVEQYLQDMWRPGQHFALCGRTGEGKTTLAAHILKPRKYVLALDAKGGDSTLEATGYRRLDRLPFPRDVRKDIAEGRPARLIIGGKCRTVADFDRLAEYLGEVLDQAFAEGGWTVYADEFQLMSDRRMMGLGSRVERLLIAARDRGTSVLTSFQAPAWVPKASTRQATWLALWRTRDTNVIKACAEFLGRPWREVEQVIQYTPSHHAVIAGPDPFAPLILTHPSRLK